jgi:predicted secreted Zn-dependent protease
LLDHERLHVRIAIEVAHEFNRDLLALRTPTVPALQTKLDRLREEKASRVQTISDAYDEATEHGRDAETTALASSSRPMGVSPPG